MGSAQEVNRWCGGGPPLLWLTMVATRVVRTRKRLMMAMDAARVDESEKKIKDEERDEGQKCHFLCSSKPRHQKWKECSNVSSLIAIL